MTKRSRNRRKERRALNARIRASFKKEGIIARPINESLIRRRIKIKSTHRWFPAVVLEGWRP